MKRKNFFGKMLVPFLVIVFGSAIASEAKAQSDVRCNPFAGIGHVEFVRSGSRAGEIAWLPRGPYGTTAVAVENCGIIQRPASVLHFTISSAVPPHSQGERVPIFVQILRVQSVPQAQRLAVSRFGWWQRDKKQLAGIQDEPLDKLSFDEFFKIHAGMTEDNPNDGPIVDRRGVLWHGTPIDGRYSSVLIAPSIFDSRLSSLIADPATILTNQLYEFVPSESSQRGMHFYVFTNGTKRLLIRTYSPNRPQFTRFIDLTFTK
jgi:hypothetical protein